MQTTKRQLLALLKRSGPQTVGRLAQDLGFASTTVRQHLTSLDRDGLVRVTAERRPKGRPEYVYELTESGERSFPKRYDRLVSQLLVELGCLDPAELGSVSPSRRVDYMLERLADRAVEQHRPRLRACSLEQRVQAVAALLQEESGFVEWTAVEHGYEIRDFNCMYRPLTSVDGPACAWHRRLIGRLLGRPPVDVETAADGSCVYVLRAEGACDTDETGGGERDTIAQGMRQVVH